MPDFTIERNSLQNRINHLEKLLWIGWHEMNAIRARSGVPLDEYGHAQPICEKYWSDSVDAMRDALGDLAKPWPPHVGEN